LSGLLAQITDPYDREARLAPALLALSPIAVAAAALVPGVNVLLSTLAAIIVSCGVAVPLSNFARDPGRKWQAELRRSQGGRTSALMLRFSDGRINPATKARYFARLTAAAGVPMPTADQERHDPVAALAIYESAVDLLLAKRTKGDKQSLEFKENVAYGYRRNTLGLRPVSMVLAAAATLAACTSWVFTHDLTRPVAVGGYAVLALIFNTWIVRPSWVLYRDEDYARQLLQTSESLPAQQSNSQEPG
jgi:hypothetical protein